VLKLKKEIIPAPKVKWTENLPWKERKAYTDSPPVLLSAAGLPLPDPFPLPVCRNNHSFSAVINMDDHIPGNKVQRRVKELLYLDRLSSCFAMFPDGYRLSDMRQQ